MFNLTDGQDCRIYKGKFEASDQIIYIPDVDLNEIETDSVLNDEAIANVLNHCCTGNDFCRSMPRSRRTCKTKGFAVRCGWHCCFQPLAPHLSMVLANGERRVWVECEVEDWTSYDRPESQGGS